jgi:polar amino acid transport system substrate-binding protein
MNNPAFADSERPELRVGYVEFPPYEYSGPNGEAAGSFLDLTRQVAAEAGYDVRFIHVPISRAYLYLRQGHIDLMPGLSNIPALRGDVLESKTHPISVELSAWSTSANPPITRFEDFYNKSLIVISGYTYGGLDDYLKQQPKITVIHAPNHQSAVEMLKLNRGDYLLDYRPPVELVIQREPLVRLQQSDIRSRTAAWLFSLANPDAGQIQRAFDNAWLRLASRHEVPMLPDISSHQVPGFPLH